MDLKGSQIEAEMKKRSNIETDIVMQSRLGLRPGRGECADARCERGVFESQRVRCLMGTVR